MLVDCSVLIFKGLPQRAAQYPLPWVWRTLRDNAAALSTTIPLKPDNRGEVKSSSPLPSFTPPNCPPTCILHDLPTPSPFMFTPSARNTSDTQQPPAPPICITSALHFLLSVSFCYSIALPVFFTLPSPPCTVWRKVYVHNMWCPTQKAEQRLVKKCLQAVSVWLIAHSHLHFYSHDGFCQTLSNCLPAPPNLFCLLQSEVEAGVTVHRYDMECVHTFTDLNFYSIHAYVKYSSSHT